MSIIDGLELEVLMDKADQFRRIKEIVGHYSQSLTASSIDTLELIRDVCQEGN